MNKITSFFLIIFLLFSTSIIAQSDSAFLAEKINLAQKNILKFEKKKNKSVKRLNKCEAPLKEVLNLYPENYAVNASLGVLYHNYCVYLLEKNKSKMLFFEKSRHKKILSEIAFYSEQSLIYLNKAKELKD